MIITVPEICECTGLRYKELWKAKQTLKTDVTKKMLKDLANPDCYKCKGEGIKLIVEKF